MRSTLSTQAQSLSHHNSSTYSTNIHPITRAQNPIVKGWCSTVQRQSTVTNSKWSGGIVILRGWVSSLQRTNGQTRQHPWLAFHIVLLPFRSVYNSIYSLHSLFNHLVPMSATGQSASEPSKPFVTRIPSDINTFTRSIDNLYGFDGYSSHNIKYNLRKKEHAAGEIVLNSHCHSIFQSRTAHLLCLVSFFIRL